MCGLRQCALCWCVCVLCALDAVSTHSSLAGDSCRCAATSGNKGSCCASRDGGGKDTGSFCGSAFHEFQCGGDSPICCTSNGDAQCCREGSTCSSGCGGGGQGLPGFGGCGCVDPPPTTAACPNPVSLEYGTACECRSDSCGVAPEVDQMELARFQAFVVTSEGVPGRIRFLDAEYMPLQSASAAAPPKAGTMALNLAPARTHQTILGFGGAFTDAVAANYEGLSVASRQNFIEQYFGRSGIGYSMGRVNMGGCDFSRMNYAYANTSGDLELEGFCLRDDTSVDAPCGSDYKIPVIRAARAAVFDSGVRGAELKVFASMWSPPTWYKDQKFSCSVAKATNVCYPSSDVGDAVDCKRTVRDPALCSNNAQGTSCPVESMDGGPDVSTQLRARARVVASNLSETRLEHAVMKKSPEPQDPVEHADGNCYNSGFLSSDDEIQASLALYFSKFIDAYEALGVNVWGVTVQNEPLIRASLWQSMYSTPELQAHFVAKHLGPILRFHHPEVHIMIHDDQTLSLLEFAGEILQNPEAMEYVDGVAYHWYMALESTFQNGPAQTPFPIGVQNEVGGGAYVRDIYERIRSQGDDKFMLMTEACNGYVLSTSWVGPRPGEWGYGYAYSHDVLWQLRNGASGWTDWNLLLDERGGPNLAGNFVDATMLVKSRDSIIQNPSFFHLAHFSKYVVPGSHRVDVDVTCGARHEDYCQAVAFLTPTGNAVVVITNDEVTVGPIAGAAQTVFQGGGTNGFCFGGDCIPNLGQIIVPQNSLGEGTALAWTVSCGGHAVSGSVPWKGIQTVVLPCAV